MKKIEDEEVIGTVTCNLCHETFLQVTRSETSCRIDCFSSSSCFWLV